MNPLITVILKQYDASGQIQILELPDVLVDTGATQSYINSDCVPPIMKTQRLKSPEIIGNAFSDKISTITNKLIANLAFISNDIEIPNVDLFIVDRQMKHNAIIGMDILQNFKIDFRDDDIKFINNILTKENLEISTVQFNKDKNYSDNDIICNQEAEIAPHSDRKIYFRSHGKSLRAGFKFFVQETFTENNIFLSITDVKNKLLTIQNRTSSVVIVERGAILGSAQYNVRYHDLNFLLTEKELEPYEKITHKKELEQWKRRRDLLVKHNPLEDEIRAICSKAPTKYKEELCKILLKHSWSFSRGVSDAGMSQNYLTELKMKQNDNMPTYTRPYKLDISMQESVEKKLKELKDSGIIEPCCSAWNSPVLFVKKKDNSIRVVNNYSASGDNSVNSRLIIPKYPSLPIRSVLAKVSAAITSLKQRFPQDKIYFVGLDVRNAFYSISIREKSREITSFLFGGEQYRYQRMSQGLSSSPSTFQYFINRVMTGTRGMGKDYHLVNYLDDFFVIVPERLHNKCVDSLLERMAEQNLVVALQKSEFYKEECKFLGFHITEKGIRADDMKVKALLELDFPKNQKEGQRFLGAVNYYGRLIPNMTALLKPLTTEIGKGKAYTLNDEIIAGIKQLKEEIKKGVSVDHLKYPENGTKEFLFVAADTSLTKTGAIIGNLHLDGDVVSQVSIAGYASKALDKQEVLLSSRARELIGLGHALKAFEDLIPKDRRFLILCDHKSLEGAKHSTKLKTSGNSRVRLAFSRILEYPLCTVHYLPGEHPVISVADALSRLPVNELGKINTNIFDPANITKESLQINEVQTFSQQKPVVDRSMIIEHQKRSDKFSKIRKKLAGKAMLTVDKVAYTLHEDLLYRSTKNGKMLAVVPKTLTKDLISFYHVATAHSGKAPIDEKLKEEPIWLENKTEYLAQAVDGCLFCNLVQPSRFRSKSDIIALKPSQRCYDKVFVDLVELSVGDNMLHYLTLLDDFSLFLSIERVNTKKTHDVIPKLILLLSEFGCQGRSLMVSDNGGEFLNHCLREALDLMHIDQSFISPYNSRANRVERSHRDLRAFIRTASLKFRDANFIVRMSCNLYNHRPKEGLNGLTPAQVARNIDPPKHFGSLKLFKGTEKLVSIIKYVELLDNYHTELAQQKREKFVVKDKRINELNIGDICVIRNPKDALNSHRKTNLGPYKVLEKKGPSAYLIEHMLLGSRIIRNRRYIVRIQLGSNERELIKSKKKLMFNNKYEILDPENKVEKIAKSPLDLQNLQKKSRENNREQVESIADNNVKSSYNLRKRKS